MAVPIALAAVALKGAQALKTADTVVKGAQAAGAVAKGAQAVNTASTAAQGTQALNKTTGGLIDKMSALAENVSSKAGGAHSAMGELVSRNNKSVSPDLGQAFEAVKPGRIEEPLTIGNSPEQNKKSSFMQGFDQGLNIAEEPNQQQNAPDM